MESSLLLSASPPTFIKPIAPKDKYRTKLCRKFALGQCLLGDRCTFIHSSLAPYPPFHHSSPLRSSLPLNRPFDGVSSPTNVVAHSRLSHPVSEPPNQSSDHIYSQRSVFPLPPPISVGNGSPSWQPVNPIPMTMPPQLTAYRPLSWKTAPCRHFTKHRGWCPMGYKCNFIHDLSLQPEEAQQLNQTSRTKDFSLRRPSSGKYRVLSGGVNVGPRRTHCWAYVQGYCHVVDCRYLHPKNIEPYIKYTPCLSWLNCSQVGCQFKHAAPVVACPRILPEAGLALQGAAMTSSKDGIPYRTYEVNGTTYFQTVPNISSTPAALSGFATTPYIYQDPWQLPSTDSQLLNSSLEAPAALTDEEALPGPDFEDSHSPPGMQPGTAADIDLPVVTEENAFPYRPSKGHPAGHARRISIALKVRDRANDGNHDGPCLSPVHRKTHSSRENRKSWSAFSLTERTLATAT